MDKGNPIPTSDLDHIFDHESVLSKQALSPDDLIWQRLPVQGWQRLGGQATVDGRPDASEFVMVQQMKWRNQRDS